MTLSPETLRQLLFYDILTGRLFWRERPSEMFAVPHMSAAWNTQWAGKEALKGVNDDGYLVGKILGKFHFAHRVIWAMQTGQWPQDDVDHENLIKSDNRWANLREATRSQNRQNTGRTIRNRSGVKGVYYISRIGKWAAKIGRDHKAHHLGCFNSKDDAAAAYSRASADLHGNFGRISCD